MGTDIEVLNLMMKLLYVLVILIGAQSQTLADTVDLRDAVPVLTNQDEVYAEVSQEVDGVDFRSWESDFNQSIENQPSDCKGKNCKFKNKQAFDPSWDL